MQVCFGEVPFEEASRMPKGIQRFFLGQPHLSTDSKVVMRDKAKTCQDHPGSNPNNKATSEESPVAKPH